MTFKEWCETRFNKMPKRKNQQPKSLKHHFSFSLALDFARNGLKIARKGWNGKGMFVSIQFPDPESVNTLPYLWMHTADGHRVPWVASQTDLLAFDWFTV